MSVVCDGQPLTGSPFVAKAFNTAAIQLTGMPSVGIVRSSVDFTGTTSHSYGCPSKLEYSETTPL